jgi:hypothetical protein
MGNKSFFFQVIKSTEPIVLERVLLKARTQIPCFFYPRLACAFRSPGYTPAVQSMSFE